MGPAGRGRGPGWPHGDSLRANQETDADESHRTQQATLLTKTQSGSPGMTSPDLGLGKHTGTKVGLYPMSQAALLALRQPRCERPLSNLRARQYLQRKHRRGCPSISRTQSRLPARRGFEPRLPPILQKRFPQPDPPSFLKNPGGQVSFNSSLSSFKTPQGYPALF